MFKSNGHPELSRADFEAARLGFLRYLRRKRFSPQFIENHADDLFSTAAVEYTRKVREGAVVKNPVGFLIAYAWRRTKSQLEAESRTPRHISTERRPGLADETAPSPEDVALEEDRFRKVLVAVKALSADERQLLARAYFEDEKVREVARKLRWHPSKAQRCHKSARRRLHDLLGVDSLDELEIEIGLAAYLSLAVGRSHWARVREGAESTIEFVGDAALYGWTRAQELARRFPIGGSAEPSTSAALGGTAGKALGACASTVAAACLATGVVGPGVGGVNMIGGNSERPAKVRESRSSDGSTGEALASAASPGRSTERATQSVPPEADRRERQKASASSSDWSRKQKRREARERFGVDSAPEGGGASSSEAEAASIEEPPSEVQTTSSSGSSSPSATAQEHFGLNP